MTDHSAKLAEFLHKIGPDTDLVAMRSEINTLVPGITHEEWMRGFAIHDECVLLDSAMTSGHPINLTEQMSAIGWVAAAQSGIRHLTVRGDASAALAALKLSHFNTLSKAFEAALGHHFSDDLGNDPAAAPTS